MKKKIRKPIKLRHVKSSPKVDLKDWNLETVEKLNSILESAVLSAAAEALQFAIDEKAFAIFALEDSEIKSKDPTAIIMSLSLSQEESPFWELSLSEIVDDLISHNSLDGRLDPDSFAKIKKIRAGFLDLISRIDKALNANKS